MLQIKYKKPWGLTAYAENTRVHSPKQIAKIRKSIKEFGFIAPVITDGDEVVCGHGRVLAALDLDLDQVPTIDISHLTTDQIRKYRIIDNRFAEFSTWDHEMLEQELEVFDDEWLQELEFPQFEAPEFEYKEEVVEPESFKLLVTVDTRNDQLSLMAKLSAEGYKVKLKG